MKKLHWVGDSLEQLREFPQEVSRLIGFSLYLVQEGETPGNAKPLKGLGGVYELVQPYDTNTFRAVYVAKFRNAVYVLHCFQKKSKRGAATPPKDIELIKQRLKQARQHAAQER